MPVERFSQIKTSCDTRALCRTKLLPVTPGPLSQFTNVDLKWTTNTHVTPFTLTSKA